MKYSGGIGVLLAAFIVLASAGEPQHPHKVYGKLWAYANNWNTDDNTVKTTFLDGKNPAMNVSFNTNAKSVIAFPSFIRGKHYDIDVIPSDTKLPQQVSKISKIKSKLIYKSGGYNPAGDFAYDLFLRKDTSKTTPELEIMIWGDHNSWPIGSQTGTNVITVAGRTFDLWEGQSGAGYYTYSFVPHDSVASVGEKQLASKGSLKVDLKEFLNWLQKNKANDGKYNDNMYLHAVEAGFEVANGNNAWVYFTGTIGIV